MCKRLKIRKLIDFSAVTETDLRAIFKNTPEIIAQIESLLERVREKYGAAPSAATHPTDKPLDQPEQTQDSLSPGSEGIFIPASARGRSLSSFAFSVRLRHVLNAAGFRLLGDLHGMVYSDIHALPNCGKKTVDEVRDWVRQLQSGAEQVGAPTTVCGTANPSILIVPAMAQDLPLADLPLSARLENILRLRGYKTLGDVNGIEIEILKNAGNCGRKTILELQEIIARASTGEFSATTTQGISAALHQVATIIDMGLAKLSKRDSTIFKARLSGNNGSPTSLENVANQFNITRERVRQIVKVIMRKLRRSGGPKLSRALQIITQECEHRMCPLTSDLFKYWLGNPAPELTENPSFYVRVLDTMEQSIPAWPVGSTREGADDPDTARIQDKVEEWMRTTGDHPSLAEAYSHLIIQHPFKKVRKNAFLASLRISKRVLVDFPKPDQPRLRLRRIQIQDLVRSILTESPNALTPEEIVERAKARYGDNAIISIPRNTAAALTPELGFFLLGPRSYGLRQHYQTPANLWPKIRTAFAALLRQENRPISTVEAVGHSFALQLGASNSYEMAQILREDDRFTDLGRRLFGLSKWGVQERERIKDLLPRVFAEANRVLTVQQALERLTRLRSVSPYSITSYLQKHPEIHFFGFGYYGLKDWGDAERRVILMDRIAVERAVRRAPQPVSFETLCRLFAVPVDGEQANLLWKSCAGSAKLRRAPEMCAPETLLLHKSVSLEQCLANISRTLQRPAPAYELQWELNAKFGQLFNSIHLSEIEQRLAQSQWFLRNGAGHFLLDEDFNADAYDAEALRAAAFKSLSESRDIAGCDELLERLEAQGFELDELSEDMLASILRGANGLQEVAQYRFRAVQ